jgi:hypothetical protein
MPLAKGSSQAVISQNIEELMNAGHSREQAAAIAYKEAGKDTADSAREVDNNGWIEVKNNPLSKVGVFPYSGGQVGGDPTKIYNVYRPAEELSHPEAIDSLKLIPWVNDHVMLGSSKDGLTPAEEKGVEGVIGEDVYFKDGILYGNIKIFSENLANLIEDGKKQLSAGYRCVYDFVSGVFNGQPYDAIQKNIRFNHLALVDEGRMGKEVAVLDHVYTYDSIDIKEFKMSEKEDEQKKAMDAMSAQLAKALDDIEDLKKKAEEKKAEDAEEDKEKEKKAEDDKDDEMALDEDKDKDDEKKGMDKAAMDAAFDAKFEGLKKSMFSEVTKRNALAERASYDIGTFDSSEMTLNETAAYIVEKLGIHCPKGSEHIALDAYYHSRPVDKTAYALDANVKPKEGVFTDFLKNKGDK